MTFKELFEKFKEKTATEAENQEVTTEIEKHALIADYLAEQSDLELESALEAAPALAEEGQGEVKQIQKALRKRNAKLISAAVGIVLSLILLFQFAVKPLLNRMFYYPFKYSYSEHRNDLTVCMGVYTDLNFPGLRINKVYEENTGIGTYRLTVARSNALLGDEEYIYGTLTRGKLSFPESFWAYNYHGAFARCFEPTVYENNKSDRDNSYLASFPEYVRVMANVSFNRDLTAEELVELHDTYGRALYFAWAGVRFSDKREQWLPIIGFDLEGTGPYYEIANKDYPCFALRNAIEHNGGKATASIYEEHFKSLLRFQLDHLKFQKALLGDRDYVGGYDEKKYYNYVLDYVEENGLKTYGVIVYGSPKKILEFYEEDFVYDIFINELALSRSSQEFIYY